MTISWISNEEAAMPTISMFYGIIVSMYYKDTHRHHQPHIHARFQDQKVVVAIPEGELLAGSLPPDKLRMLLAWVAIHKNELMADGKLRLRAKNHTGSIR